MNSDEGSVDPEPILRAMATQNLWITKTSRWQTLMFVLLAAYNIFGSAANFTDYFVSDETYVCAIPPNVSRDEAIPLVQNEFNELVFSKCEVFKDFNQSTNQTIPCPLGYNHSVADRSHSLVAVFNLYCSRRHLLQVPLATFLFGVLVGSIVCGVTGDKFGRRPLVLSAFWTSIVAGIGCAFSSSLYLFAFFRFICGMCFQIYGLSCYVMAVELFATEDRAIPCVYMNILWTIGMLLLDGFAYFVRSFRWIYFATYFSVVLTIPYYWIVPESLYWLAVKGKIEEMNLVLKKAYTINRTPDHQQLFASPLLDNSSSGNQEVKVERNGRKSTIGRLCVESAQSLKTMFRSKPFVYAFLCASIFQLLSNFSYLGLTFAASTFSTNLYLQFFITSLLEIPGVVLAGPLLNRFGRKYPCIVCHVLWAIVAIAFGLINDQTVLTVLNHFSKLLMVVTYSVIWLYTPELFPTRYRGFACGITTSFAKFAAIFSAFFSTLLTSHRAALLISLAGCSLLISVLTIFLPDTNENVVAEISEMKSMRQCARMCYPKRSVHTANEMHQS